MLFEPLRLLLDPLELDELLVELLLLLDELPVVAAERLLLLGLFTRLLELLLPMLPLELLVPLGRLLLLELPTRPLLLPVLPVELLPLFTRPLLLLLPVRPLDGPLVLGRVEAPPLLGAGGLLLLLPLL